LSVNNKERKGLRDPGLSWARKVGRKGEGNERGERENEKIKMAW